MAYPTKLNNQYKAEKAAGTTTAKSFPEWYKTYQINQQAAEQQLGDLEAFLENTVVEEVVKEVKPLVLHTTVELELHKLFLTPPAEVTPEVKLSKAAQARLIYDQMEQAATTAKLKLVRKDVINRFMIELPISKVGASTYLQNIKIKKGLVNHK